MKVLTRGTLTIDVQACKGCDLCIAACPPQVLVMTDASEVNDLGFPYPRLRAGCTGCLACLQVCPDFCFEVYKLDPPVEMEVEELEATA
jgi:2-oxoglutarate ferredoxin oxidoreductase subunit delta